ncbi:polyphenol oxidase, chloroplastic-like [Silene latifolia]|uniref:polyphenol oxidase, chloroplastic-like n=1 Tax=Silene latifolia TaxID=37657 RepID=UPI003D775164
MYKTKMASLSPSTINNLTIPQNPQIISNNKLRLRSKKSIISCKNHNNKNENPNNKTPILDRRNMLIGLGGLYGSTLPLITGSPANAEPMAPDVYGCALTDAGWEYSVGDYCCPPKFPDEIKEFRFEDYPSPVLKVRRPAHEVSKEPEFVRDYNRAISIMRTGLTPFDPRNFYEQAKIHCAYCDASYPQLNNPDKRMEVHNNWLFASFHRWYIFFFERIMGKMIDKPDFALPFWNWDHPKGMKMPEMFKDMDSSLYDPNRDIDHMHSMIDLTFSRASNKNRISNESLVQQNLKVMRKQMVYPAKPSLFFGAEYRLGDDIDREEGAAGALERSPHNVVHDWTGSATVGGRGHQDMGSFWSSGRDPAFYCHHSNVDRMWHLWRTVLDGGSRVDIREPDYLNAWFVFYDENAIPVKVKVRDSLDIEKLGYTYQDVELPWLSTPRPRISPYSELLRMKPPVTPESSVTFPKALDSVIKTLVRRPSKSLGRSMREKEEEEEILVIEFELCHAEDQFVKFDVYVNDPIDHNNDDEDTMVTPEMAGTYTALPHRRMQHKMMNGKDEKKRKSTLKLALNTLLKEIGIEDDDTIEVALVPRSGTKCLNITGVKIGFTSE